MCVFLFFSGCYAQPKIHKLTLYNTIGDELNEKDLTFHILENYRSVSYNDDTILTILNNAKKTNSRFIWKGNIYGKILFTNNDSTMIKISRYGSFFKDLKTKRIFYFKSDYEKRYWTKTINDFLGISE